jgi:hypothetical protein
MTVPSSSLLSGQGKPCARQAFQPASDITTRMSARGSGPRMPLASSVSPAAIHESSKTLPPPLIISRS